MRPGIFPRIYESESTCVLSGLCRRVAVVKGRKFAMKLEELDSRKVRMISIEGRSIQVLLEDGTRQTFEFRSANELSLALRLWNDDERVTELLQGSGIDRESGAPEEE